MTTTNLDMAKLGDLMTLMSGDEKHDSSATSTLDAIWVLYDRVLTFDPARPDDPNRDRFLLSKGHGPMAYYAVLAAKGLLPVDALIRFGDFESVLGQHPDRMRAPGVEISAGSLGHGLGLAVGTALGLRMTGRPRCHVFVLVGDAELEEGSNFEAIQYAGRVRLGGLTAIVIDNSSASLGWPGGIGSRFAGEGWSFADADGRDHDDLERAYRAANPDRPHAVIVHVEPKGR